MIFATKILDRGSLVELDGQPVVQASLSNTCSKTDKLVHWVLHNLLGTRDTDLLLRRPIALKTQQFCYVCFVFFSGQFYSFCKMRVTTLIGPWPSANLNMLI